MSDTMRAFVIKEVGRTEVMEKPIPTPGPEEAIVKTTAALICTSDVHTVKGALPVPNDRTLGHESVGVVHALGLGRHGVHRGPARGRQRGHAVLPLQLLPARLHQPVRRRARRLQVHRPDGRQHGRVLRRPRRAGQPHAHPRRPFRRAGRLQLRHALHRLHGRRARLPAVRRDRGGVRAGPGRAVRHDGRQPPGRGPDHRRRVPPGAAGAGQAVRRGRHRRLHPGRPGRADHGHDRRRGRRRRDRGVRLPADLRGVPARDEGGRARLQHRLPRREPGTPAAAARRVRAGHERQVHPHRPLPRWQRAHEPPVPRSCSPAGSTRPR